jgi:hypothetical protein
MVLSRVALALEVAVELRLIDHHGRPCFIWLPRDLFEVVRATPKR